MYAPTIEKVQCHVVNSRTSWCAGKQLFQRWLVMYDADGVSCKQESINLSCVHLDGHHLGWVTLRDKNGTVYMDVANVFLLRIFSISVAINIPLLQMSISFLSTVRLIRKSLETVFAYVWASHVFCRSTHTFTMRLNSFHQAYVGMHFLSIIKLLRESLFLVKIHFWSNF